jgi:hypothetical protein
VRVLADLTVLVHAAFLAFVVLGGLAVLRWRRLVWLHVPAVLWGAVIEFTGWICPLTPLENRFRAGAGAGAYEGGFIDHYILPVVYPEGLTRELQVGLGLAVLALNLVLYGWMVARGRRPAPNRP